MNDPIQLDKWIAAWRVRGVNKYTFPDGSTVSFEDKDRVELARKFGLFQDKLSMPAESKGAPAPQAVQQPPRFVLTIYDNKHNKAVDLGIEDLGLLTSKKYWAHVSQGKSKARNLITSWLQEVRKTFNQLDEEGKKS